MKSDDAEDLTKALAGIHMEEEESSDGEEDGSDGGSTGANKGALNHRPTRTFHSTSAPWKSTRRGAA